MWRVTIFTALTLAMSGASAQVIASQDETPLKVFASNYPLAYFAQRIAGDRARVVLPAPAEVDPAYWTPSEGQLLDMHRADLILMNGAGYERWMSTLSLPLNRVVDTTAALSDHYIYSDEVTTHTHGPAGEHSHENLAFTTWLDLQIAAAQARQVGDALIASMPEYEESLSRNLNSLNQELESLDSELRSIGQRLEGVPLLASHPVYQYFARQYGLALQSLHWEPGDIPPDQEWLNLEVLLGSHPAKWMIWEASPHAETRKRLVGLGIQTLVIKPTASPPSEGDFLTVMQENAEALAEILSHSRDAAEKPNQQTADSSDQ